MIYFLLSLVPLVAAPFLVQWLQASPWTTRALDAFVLVAVTGLVVLHLLPHAIHEGGLTAAGAALAGFFLPILAEGALHRARSLVLNPALLLAVGLLTVHGLLDGVALAAPGMHADHGEMLAAAVVLHRVPDGLTVWWVARPHLGRNGAVAVLALLIAGTTAGFVTAGMGLGGLFEGPVWAVLQALLAGSLVHVVAHHSLGSCVPLRGGARAAWAVGGAMAVAALTLLDLLEAGHGHGLLHGLAPALLGLALLLGMPHPRVQRFFCRSMDFHHHHPGDHAHDHPSDHDHPCDPDHPGHPRH
ncbi:MAG: hypothetical protein FJ098_10855 [Deltaproteobacteria bacterium]|nr:hypothetical protein [Deltaproteobacteria bacterium]